MKTGSSSGGRKFVLGAAIFLAIIHQDLWWWDDRTLVFGFMPIGLAYHALFSCMAAVLWAVAIKVAWPTEIEEWAESDDESASEEENQ